MDTQFNRYTFVVMLSLDKKSRRGCTSGIDLIS
ncbi:unnamed protein product [Acanthoscelides obtectus]|uniref:Uncharacterized protein n=1 Tax=Acanthoscelides obtectus TaxID=200917 RepID=A0A9P0MF68_ACAOB|nr:unnamed protein product [Acanthoscelides obtectus]CAK1689396.1 hypothetical protein AOBTE_LOCUS37222 [Acanthoscelides obtectus]